MTSQNLHSFCTLNSVNWPQISLKSLKHPSISLAVARRFSCPPQILCTPNTSL